MITLPYSKIEGVPPKDGERPVIEDVWFDAKKSRLVASDGFILAVVPVKAEESDTTGHVPLEAIKEARKATRGRAYLEAGETVTCPFSEGGSWTRQSLNYPDADQIVPSPDEGYVSLTLDARRLMQLAEALCEDDGGAKKKGDPWGVTLTFKPDGVSPVLVHPWPEPNNGPRGRFGVIMPMWGGKR